MKMTNALEYKIHEIIARIKELRAIEGIAEEEMAARMGMEAEEYRAYEKYFEGDKEKGDRALYFTSPSFARIKEYELAGMYKDSVAIVCL